MNAPDRIWAWPSDVASGSDGLWLARDPTGDTRWAEEYLRATPELLALIAAARTWPNNADLVIQRALAFAKSQDHPDD